MRRYGASSRYDVIFEMKEIIDGIDNHRDVDSYDYDIHKYRLNGVKATEQIAYNTGGIYLDSHEENLTFKCAIKLFIQDYILLFILAVLLIGYLSYLVRLIITNFLVF